MGRGRLDVVAAGASVPAIGALVAYLAVMREQGDEPLVLVVAVLALGAAAAAYGAIRSAPLRRSVLLIAGLVLLALGVLAILSIGLPILVAGGLCLLAAGRAQVPRPGDPAVPPGAQTA